MEREKIKILNLTYEIKEVPIIDHDETTMGMVSHHDQVIYIKNNLTEERKEVVLIHEIIHSIFQQLEFTEENENEHLVQSLATAIYQVFKDNVD